MLERGHNFIGEKIYDTLMVTIPNGIVLAVVRLVDVKTVAEITLIALTAAYTIWRWRKDSRR